MDDLLKDEFFIKMVNNPDMETEYYWQRWLLQNPERQGEFEIAKQFIQSLKYKNVKVLSAADHDRIFSEIRSFKQKIDEQESNLNLKNQRYLPTTILRVAAVIVFMVTVGFGIYSIISVGKPYANYATAEIIEKVVPMGAKLTVTMEDGTVIRLNSGSRLTYPKEFSDSIRSVEISGEGFFDVAHEAARPFIIKTGAINTMVLGTKFNVRSVEDEDEIQIALVSGRVEVDDSKGKKTILEPSEMAVYSKRNQEIQKKEYDMTAVTSWKDDILVFKKSSLVEIIDKLEQWYGVNIKVDVKTPIMGLYSGEYHDEPLDRVLQGIGYASGFQFEIDGLNVKIKN